MFDNGVVQVSHYRHFLFYHLLFTIVLILIKTDRGLTQYHFPSIVFEMSIIFGERKTFLAMPEKNETEMVFYKKKNRGEKTVFLKALEASEDTHFLKDHLSPQCFSLFHFFKPITRHQLDATVLLPTGFFSGLGSLVLWKLEVQNYFKREKQNTLHEIWHLCQRQ